MREQLFSGIVPAKVTSEGAQHPAVGNRLFLKFAVLTAVFFH